ncbi:MAG: hypothetical protein WAK90_05895 [Pseudolabrys sp.]
MSAVKSSEAAEPDVFETLTVRYHRPGQFTPGAYGSSRLYGYGSRLYGRIVETPDSARDFEFTACFVSDIRLAAKLGPETASNNPKAIATT